jgi:hypothetical protein
MHELQLADRAIPGDQFVQPAHHRWHLLRLAGQDQHHAAAGQARKLRVEEIGADRLFQRDAGGGHLDDDGFGQAIADLRVKTVPVGKGLFVGEEHGFIGHRDHVIVKSPGSDGLVALAGKDGIGQGVAADQRL